MCFMKLFEQLSNAFDSALRDIGCSFLHVTGSLLNHVLRKWIPALVIYSSSEEKHQQNIILQPLTSYGTIFSINVTKATWPSRFLPWKTGFRNVWQSIHTNLVVPGQVLDCETRSGVCMSLVHRVTEVHQLQLPFHFLSKKEGNPCYLTLTGSTNI